MARAVPVRRPKGTLVTDLLIVALSGVLFGAAAYFVRVCDRI